MKNNFWQVLTKPFFALAPMDDVTDTVFRQVVARCKKPDVFYTEFTSCEGLLSDGKDFVNQRLKYTNKERPIVAQIWGNNPDSFYKVAQILQDLKFDGIDINMGCPHRKVLKTGCGGALILNNDLAKEIISATKKGAPKLPISVKTRLAKSTDQTLLWTSFLLEQDIDVLTIHGRTVKQLNNVPADWDEIGKIVKHKDSIKSHTLIIGNGDIKNVKDGMNMFNKYKIDGIMIGRGIFDNIYAFDKESLVPDTKTLINLCLFHIDLYEKTWGVEKNYNILKKFFKIYIKDFSNSSKLRELLYNTNNASEAKAILLDYLTQI